MSGLTIQLLQAFEKLPPEEKDDFLKALLRQKDAPDGKVDLATRGIDLTQAADLRSRLKTFAEDWERPEDEVYDQVPSR